MENIPPAVAAILQNLGPPIQEQVHVEERTFLISRPSLSDQRLDQSLFPGPDGQAGYIPFWADLWPAARMLAKVILQESWPAETPALEIGCGLGLPGIVALSKGLRVTFSDFDPRALYFAAANARLNGFENTPTLQLDWRSPPPDLLFPLILAADVIYEMTQVEPLVAFIRQALAPKGTGLLTDLDRIPSQTLRRALDLEKLTYTTQFVRAGEPGGRRLKGTLYRIGRP